MKILYLCHILPVPEVNGDLRHYQFVRGLARRHTVRLVVGAHDVPWEPEDLRRLRGCLDRIDIVQLQAPVVRRSARIANRLGRSLSAVVDPWWVDCGFERAVSMAIAEFRPDVIHANVPTAKHCSRIRSVPMVVDLCDAVSLQSPLHGGLLRRLCWLRGFREIEAFIGSFADRVITISARDAKAINCPGWKVSVVRNGVDPDYYHPSAGNWDERTVCFVGAMDYAPNIDGVVYFAWEVWPMVRKSIPDARLVVVGRNPVAEVCRVHGRDGIIVTGTVDDVRPYVRRSAATIAPLRYASGLQNKVIQSLAMGVPVVVTPAANGGIGAGEKDGVICGSDSAGLAQGVVRLMMNPAYRDEMGSRGRRFVELNYTWKRALGELENVYEEAIKSRDKIVTSDSRQVSGL